MLNDPLSSPKLTGYINTFLKTGDISSLTAECFAWLSNGGDDGTVNSKLY